MLRNFAHRVKLLKLFWIGQQFARNKILKLSQIRNSRTSEYHSTRKLSPLSDGSLSDSKHSVNYELRLSEIDRVAESGETWTDRTFRHKSGSWQNFAMTSPDTLYMKNAVNKYRFPLVTHMAYFDTRFGCYGHLKSVYSAGQILDRLNKEVKSLV
jgi:hypothetical protein